MVQKAKNRRITSISGVVDALSANPPRVRSALEGLRWLFETGSDSPSTVLAACARLLNTTEATTPEILTAVREVMASWDTYDPQVHTLFHRCVYTSETRTDCAATEPRDIVALLHTSPPRIGTALDALRWYDATTGGRHRDVLTVCATLLKNPSATHPTIVEAIQQAHRLWPHLDEDTRALTMACVYASKARAYTARQKHAQQARRRETETGDIHRCGNCDGNLADTPGLAYCSEPCRREAETSHHPDTTTHTDTGRTKQAPAPATTPAPTATQTTPEAADNHDPDDADEFTDADECAESEEPADYRDTRTGAQARRDLGVVDTYEDTRPAVQFEDRAEPDDATGWKLWDDDYLAMSVRDEDPRYIRTPFRASNPRALCIACNLERTPAEQRGHNDGRCEACHDAGKPPLHTFAPAPELIAA